MKINKLKNTLCYLGGNLENTSDAENWRKDFAKELKKRGVISLDPTKMMFQDQIEETEEMRTLFKTLRQKKHFKKLHLLMKDIIRRDLRAIDLCTFTIFKLEPNKPTWGTVHEIVVASNQRKPILILINDIKQMPLWLVGLVNMDFVFENKSDLFSYVDELNNGSKKMDSKYWKILKE